MPSAGMPSPPDGIRFIISRVDRMAVNRMPDRTLILAGALLLLTLAATPAASAVAVYPGSEVTLTGTSTGSDTVYLFVTGPNLPPAGGRLDDPHTPVRPGDPGSFTAVTVGSDDRWTYRWRTGEAGLDPGTYTVYAVDAPVDRRNLAGHGYTTIPVTLGSPPGTAAPGTAVPAASPVETETPTATIPATTPAPEPTTAAPSLAVLMTAGAAVAAAIIFLRR
ncbi:hypothetical protein [Methanoculleus sp. MH98A]|uniref:hypothetical protein n=1 Tax=Methanoculleus sp. MH98A TaxID=1495314 RepID=UPI00049EC50C|nr:hypothetical protein [Methanoculleus sp. MH98A]KDE54989.1 hypothetical protein EI28_10220 [Methanoculleus sp. MH98A]